MSRSSPPAWEKLCLPLWPRSPTTGSQSPGALAPALSLPCPSYAPALPLPCPGHTSLSLHLAASFNPGWLSPAAWWLSSPHPLLRRALGLLQKGSQLHTCVTQPCSCAEPVPHEPRLLTTLRLSIAPQAWSAPKAVSDMPRVPREAERGC